MAVFLRNQKNVTKTPSPYPAPTPLRPPHERTRVLRVTTTTTTDDDDDDNNNNNDYDDVDVDDYDDDGGGGGDDCGRRATEATATPNRRRSRHLFRLTFTSGSKDILNRTRFSVSFSLSLTQPLVQTSLRVPYLPHYRYTPSHVAVTPCAAYTYNLRAASTAITE